STGRNDRPGTNSTGSMSSTLTKRPGPVGTPSACVLKWASPLLVITAAYPEVGRLRVTAWRHRLRQVDPDARRRPGRLQTDRHRLAYSRRSRQGGADTPELTQRRQAQIALARSGRLAEVADQQFPLVIHPSRHGDPAVRGLVRLMAEETGAEAFIRQQQAIIGRVDSRPGLGPRGLPTLVLVGAGDQLTPPELSAEIAGAIPGARLLVIADAGHLTPLEQPEQGTNALLEWLQACARSGA